MLQIIAMAQLLRVAAATTGTVPQGAAGTGTINFPAGSELGIVSGSTWAAAHNDFKNGTTSDGTENLWLYIPAANEVRRITGVSIIQDQTGVSLAVSVWIENPFTAAVVAQVFQVVNGDLRYFKIVNDGAANGLVNGLALTNTPFDNVLERNIADYPKAVRPLDVVTFNSAGTSFLIDEDQA